MGRGRRMWVGLGWTAVAGGSFYGLLYLVFVRAPAFEPLPAAVAAPAEMRSVVEATGFVAPDNAADIHALLSHDRVWATLQLSLRVPRGAAFTGMQETTPDVFNASHFGLPEGHRVYWWEALPLQPGDKLHFRDDESVEVRAIARAEGDSLRVFVARSAKFREVDGEMASLFQRSPIAVTGCLSNVQWFYLSGQSLAGPRMAESQPASGVHLR